MMIMICDDCDEVMERVEDIIKGNFLHICPVCLDVVVEEGHKYKKYKVIQ